MPNQPQRYTYRQVMQAFKASLVACEAHVIDSTVPDPCASVGGLFVDMGFRGQRQLERDQINQTALQYLDQFYLQKQQL